MENTGYDIRIGNDLLRESGSWAQKCLGGRARKIVLVSNPKVFGLYGDIVRESFSEAGFEVEIWLMKDGERYKNFRSLESLLNFFSESRLGRTDAAVALGGGVVGDLTGFASAVYLRGIRFLQIPTTLLAMIDSSVGGKTAVNTPFGKNLIGAFHQPSGVLIDSLTLRTLHKRELTAGFCEAVKQGAVASEELFSQTAEFLKIYPQSKIKRSFSDGRFLNDLEKIIDAQISFKAEIVAQDEQESIGRKDVKSRKILNFGHTLAHALETVTGYRYFKHGEAVGYGILFAAELAKKLELFSADELKLLNDVVHRTGSLPRIPEMSIEKVIESIKYDKKSVNGSLQWVLLEKIGKPIIVSDEIVSDEIILETLREFLRR